MSSRYLLQIVDRHTGEAVQLEPGLQAERDFIVDCVQEILSRGRPVPLTYDSFIADCVTAIVKRGVGLGRTSAHVAQDIRDGIQEVLVGGQIQADLRALTIGLESNIATGIEAAITNLKTRIHP